VRFSFKSPIQRAGGRGDTIGSVPLSLASKIRERIAEQTETDGHADDDGGYDPI